MKVGLVSGGIVKISDFSSPTARLGPRLHCWHVCGFAPPLSSLTADTASYRVGAASVPWTTTKTASPAGTVAVKAEEKSPKSLADHKSVTDAGDDGSNPIAAQLTVICAGAEVRLSSNKACFPSVAR